MGEGIEGLLALLGKGIIGLTTGKNATGSPEEQKVEMAPKMKLSYNALLSQSYNMPAYNSQLCTKVLLQEIKEKKCYMFLTGEIVKHNVMHPPPIRILQKTVVEQMKLANSKGMRNGSGDITKEYNRLIEFV